MLIESYDTEVEVSDHSTEAFEYEAIAHLEVDISEANGVLVDVIGGTDMTIAEAERAAEEIQSRVGQNARIIWGAAVDPALDKTVKVMLVATGVKSKQILGKANDRRFKGANDLEVVH